MILFEKFGQHQPLNRQAERYAREGVPISLSTMADAVGSACAALAPLTWRLESHVLAAERLHGDDTTVPVLAKGKTDIGRCWVYVRDDKPFGGTSPPAAMFYYYRDRKGEHPAKLLFDYEHRFEAYVPREKRVMGYFAVPVLIGNEIVAAIDLKADRTKKKLLI
jgi:transposase